MTRPTADNRRRLFALAYAKEPNEKKALAAAGYKPGGNQACVLLRHPIVREVLDQQAALASAATGVDVASIVRDLDELRQVDIGDVFETDKEGNPVMRSLESMSRSARRSITKIKVTKRTITYGFGDDKTTEEIVTTDVDIVDRLGVLQKLGNHVGAFKAADKPPEPGNTYIVVVPEPMKSVEEWSQQLPARK